MRGIKYVTCFMMFVLVTSILLIATAPSAAYAQDSCSFNGLNHPKASATLSLAVPHIDDAIWTSTLVINVPVSWPLAYNLFQDTSSELFQRAYTCLLPDNAIWGFFGRSFVVVRNQDYVKIRVIDHSMIDSQDTFVPPPWNMDYSKGRLLVAFQPGQNQAGLDWTTVTATAHGFRMADPTPLPASEPSDARWEWYPASGATAKLASFVVIPPPLLRITIWAQSGGDGQYIPLDVESIAFLLTLILIFRRRYKREIDKAGKSWRDTRRLCLAVGTLWIIQLVGDIESQLPVPFWSHAIQSSAYIITICIVALATFWSRLGKFGKTSAITATILINLYVIDGLGVYFPPVTDPYFISILDNPPLKLLLSLCLAFLTWAVILDIALTLWRPRFSFMRRPSSLILAASILALLSESPSSWQSQYSSIYTFPVSDFRDISSYLIIFGTLLIIARGRRPVPLLLEGSDRLLLAVTVGYVLLVTGPQWYIGFRFGLVPILGFALSMIVLSSGKNHSLIRPASAILKKRTPVELQDLQKRLFSAQKRLDEVTKDLKALEGTPLTDEQLKRRDLLKKEGDRLRSWPTDEPPAPADPPKKLRSKMYSWFGLPKNGEEHDDKDSPLAFPEPVGPVDVALALGPACDPAGNMRRARWRALVLIVIPVSYFAWRQSLPGLSAVANIQLYYSFIASFLQELTFWLSPLMMLAVAWSSLVGRRGSSRGLQLWICFSLPLIGHAAINQMLDQSATLTSILRSALLLIVLLLLGVWLDLSTVREYRSDVTSVRLLQGYVRLNRVVATATLLIPLATAGLTIWTQIDNGVLHQKVPQTQVTVKAPAPSPTPSSTSSPTPSPRG